MAQLREIGCGFELHESKAYKQGYKAGMIDVKSEYSNPLRNPYKNIDPSFREYNLGYTHGENEQIELEGDY